MNDATDRLSPRARRQTTPKRRRKRASAETAVIGWREWVGLPELGIEAIKAKIDTGARTSTLHAYHVVPFEWEGRPFVRFWVHPVQRHRRPTVECVAPLVERRTIRDSGGKIEERYVVRTDLRIGTQCWPIELTLTNRDEMSFRMLVGRAAIRGKFAVDPGVSFRMGGRPDPVKAMKTSTRSQGPKP